jgi:Lar family restriction alleviation protein
MNLKPCPHCSGAAMIKARIITGKAAGYRAHCSACGDLGPEGRTPAEAAEKWNHRPEEAVAELAGGLDVALDALRLRPREEWHDDTGNVLWWWLPISGPPYVGTPLDTDWPEDPEPTYWTPLLVPEEGPAHG